MHPSFPCKQFLRLAAHAKYPAMTAVYGTFGTSTKCIKSFVEKFRNRPHLVEMIFDNDTCRRNGRTCHEGEIAPGLSGDGYSRALEQMPREIRSILERRTKEITKITRLGNSRTRWVLSIGLEDNHNAKAAKRKLRVIRRFWPFELVRNPASDHVIAPSADIIELHAESSDFGNLPCIWNQDGLVLTPNEVNDLFYRYTKCIALFAWTAEAQGILGDFVKPRERTFIITPKDEQVYGKILSGDR